MKWKHTDITEERRSTLVATAKQNALPSLPTTRPAALPPTPPRSSPPEHLAGNRLRSCPYCTFTSRSGIGFATHVRSHRNMDKTVTPPILRTTPAPSESEPIQCPECNDIFYRPSGFAAHLRKHAREHEAATRTEAPTPPPPPPPSAPTAMPCPYPNCQFVGSRPSGFAAHLRKHERDGHGPPPNKEMPPCSAQPITSGTPTHIVPQEDSSTQLDHLLLHDLSPQPHPAQQHLVKECTATSPRSAHTILGSTNAMSPPSMEPVLASLCKQVNALPFSRKPPVAAITQRERLQLPRTKTEWNATNDHFNSRCPQHLLHQGDPCSKTKQLVDFIHSVFSHASLAPKLQQRPPHMRRQPLPQNITDAADTKHRFRQLIRQHRAAKLPLDDHYRHLTQQYHLAVRVHNRLIRNYARDQLPTATATQMSRYARNPFQYCRNLLDNTEAGPTIPPECTAETAHSYFTQTYADPDRDAPIEPFDLPHISPPTHPYDNHRISPGELLKAVKKKSDSSAPGPDAIPYPVIKRLPLLQRILVILFNDIMHTRQVPEEWKQGRIVLLLKPGGNAANPADFRPIALTSTIGKLFTSILAARIEHYMRANLYWDTAIQKGFARNIQGCIEHGFTLQSALTHARRHRRNISVTWLDIKNAFGSTKHKLIQLSLRRYHVPEPLCQIIYSQYDGLAAIASTSVWSTAPFAYERGVFQGDPLSPCIFNICFNAIIEQLQRLNSTPYCMPGSIRVNLTAYADDLALVTQTGQQQQRILDRLHPTMTWLQMSFKPSKCVHLVINQGKVKHNRLFIDQQPVQSLTDGAFKFLGVFIPADGNLKPIWAQICQKAIAWWDTITATPLSVTAKLFAYKYTISRLRWNLLTHDWPLTWVRSLQSVATRNLKQWIGLSRSGNTSFLYSPHALKLPNLVVEHMSLHTLKQHHLQTCDDPTIKSLCATQRLDRRRKWHASTQLANATAFVASEDTTAQLLQQANLRGHGLGYHSPSRKGPQRDTFKDRLKRFVKDQEHAIALQRTKDLFCLGPHWKAIEEEQTHDSSWHRALAALPDRLLRFVSNAVTNTLPTNANIYLWKKLTNDPCPLCKQIPQTLGHILNSCPTALTQGRYNYRHDSILQFFHVVLRQCLPPEYNVCSSIEYQQHLSYVFPIPGITTEQRPDCIIHHPARQEVWLLELTVPREKNISAAYGRKKSRYKDLTLTLQQAGYTATLLPYEISSLGVPANSARLMLRTLGLSQSVVRRTLEGAARIAMTTSHTIFSYRNAPAFNLPLEALPDTSFATPIATGASARSIPFVSVGCLMPTDPYQHPPRTPSPTPSSPAADAFLMQELLEESGDEC